jgi:hypothetical protein
VSVVEWKTAFVPVLVAVTSTPGATAPLGSLTIPSIAPVTSAAINDADATANNTTIKQAGLFLNMSSAPFSSLDSKAKSSSV